MTSDQLKLSEENSVGHLPQNKEVVHKEQHYIRNAFYIALGFTAFGTAVAITMPEKFQKGKRHAIATFEDVFHEPGNHDAAAIQSHIYRERFESMYQEKLASIQEEYKEVIASSEDKHHLFDDMHDKPFAVIRTFVDKHIRSFTYRRTLFEKTYEDPYRPGEIIQKTEWGPAIDDFLADQSRFQELYNAFHNVLIEEDQNIRSELEHRKQKRHSNNLSRLPLLHK